MEIRNHRCSEKMMSTLKRQLLISIDGILTAYRLAHLRKILKITENFFDQIIVIYNAESKVLSNNSKVRAINLKRLYLERNFLLKIFIHLYLEFKKVKMLIKYSSKSHYVMFLGIYQPLLLIISKLRGNYAFHFCGGFDIMPKKGRLSKVDLIVRWFIQVLMLKLSDKLIFEAPSVMSYFNLKKYKRKAFCNGHLFVDLSKFYPTIPISQRNYDICYIGAFSREKGIIQFVKSLPLIMGQRKVKVQIVGDGVLNNAVKKYISACGLGNLVHFKRPVEYSRMPQVLNTIKLLVVPSYSEGLPNIIIEAMACGTVVLANPVGGIPDIIKQGENGFLLRSNNPKEIAQKIIELIDRPKLLEKVSNNAYEYVIKNFSYEQSLKNWRECFNEIKL